jgi:Carboxypeptidase regulatory-like domain
MRGFLVAAFFLATTYVLVPTSAHAQQVSITGVVRDTSGAVLPGVAVEASSPALIEKVRSVTTDGTGQYRIVDLRPGDYTVTFTLAGFSTVARAGIELTGSFTATVNADLRVGSLEETIRVSGESPVVDVQSAKRQQVLSDELIQAIPTARVYHSLMGLIPGINLSGTSDVGGIGGPAVITFSMHGGRFSEGRLQLDGTSTGAAVGASGTSYYVVDVGNAQEVTFSTSGGMGESETGGPLMNVVPRQGGNVVKWDDLQQWRVGRPPKQQLHAGPQGRGTDGPRRTAEDLGPQRDARWSATQRTGVVRRDRAIPGQSEVRRGDVLQQERRGPGILDL